MVEPARPDFAQLARAAVRSLEGSSVLVAAAGSATDPLAAGMEHHAIQQAERHLAEAIRYLDWAADGCGLPEPKARG